MVRYLDPQRLGDHVDRLYRAAWALTGSREDAEDLVQETYARVLARPRLVRNDDDVGYLLRALRNTFLAQLRTRARRPRTVSPPDELDAVEERTEVVPEAAAEAREVFRAIALLPADYRDAVAAVDVAGLSYEEAAGVLGIPVGTVMSRLYRGRQRVVRVVDGP